MGFVLCLVRRVERVVTWYVEEVIDKKLTSSTSMSWARLSGMGYVNIRVGLVETSRTSGDLGNLFM